MSTLAQTLVGAVPGALWYAFAPCAPALVIMGLGAFICFGSSLPGFSGNRAARLLAWSLTKNVPPKFREQLVDHVAGEEQTPADPAVHRALHDLDVPQD